MSHPRLPRVSAFEPRRHDTSDWTPERIAKLERQEIEQLRANALELGEDEVAALCAAALTDGSRPWYDSAAGQERLKHCQLVMQGAAAEGLLVFGDALEGHAPEEKARSVHGVDPQTVVRFSVEKRGQQYWAIWGKRSSAAN